MGDVTERMLIVGERPAFPGRPDTPVLLEEWPIYQTLDDWLFEAGFQRGDIGRVRFENVVREWQEGPPTREQIRRAAVRLEELIYEEGFSLVITLGRPAAAVMGCEHHDYHRHAGRTWERVVTEDAPVVGGQVEPILRGRVFRVLPLPHPSGRNRFFNDERGRWALTVALKELDRLRGG